MTESKNTTCVRCRRYTIETTEADLTFHCPSCKVPFKMDDEAIRNMSESVHSNMCLKGGHTTMKITGQSGGTSSNSNNAGVVRGDQIKGQKLTYNNCTISLLKAEQTSLEESGKEIVTMQSLTARRKRLFKDSPNFEKVRNVLEKQKVVVLTGGPCEGKTTLAANIADKFMRLNSCDAIYFEFPKYATCLQNTDQQRTLYVLDNMFQDNTFPPGGDVRTILSMIEKQTLQSSSSKVMCIIVCQLYDMKRAKSLFHSPLLVDEFLVDITSVNDLEEHQRIGERLAILNTVSSFIPRQKMISIAEQKPFMMGFAGMCSNYDRIKHVDMDYFQYPHSFYREQIKKITAADYQKAGTLVLMLFCGGRIHLSALNCTRMQKKIAALQDFISRIISFDGIKKEIGYLTGTFLIEDESGYINFRHQVLYDACLAATDDLYPGNLLKYCQLKFIDDNDTEDIPESTIVITKSHNSILLDDLSKQIEAGNFHETLSNPLLDTPGNTDMLLKKLQNEMQHLLKSTDMIKGGHFLFWTLSSTFKHLIDSVVKHPDLSAFDIQRAIVDCIENNSLSGLQFLKSSINNCDEGVVEFEVNFKSNGSTPLMLATHCGNADIVQFLLKNGADPSITDEIGQNCVHIAAAANDIELYKMFESLEEALALNQRDVNGLTPPMAVCGKKGSILDYLLSSNLGVNRSDLETMSHRQRTQSGFMYWKGQRYSIHNMLELLMSIQTDLSVSDDNQDTVLNVACCGDNIEIIKYLLRLKSVNINVRGHNGRTPVMTAAQEGCRRVFDLLKTEGSDLSVLDDYKNTILHVACIKDNVEFVKYLLTLNIVDINVRGQNGRTPVMTAAQEGCRRVFDLLKTEGSDLSVLDDDKDTILHAACFNDNVEFVKYLLTLNIVDINVRGHNGMTPVMTAAAFGCRRVFDLLKTEGSDLSILDDHKNTILHAACNKDNVEFVKYLLTLNIVDINVRGQYAQTPVMTAAKFGCRIVFDLLMTEGSDLSVLDDHKDTILHAACNKDNVEFVKYLLTLNIVDINVRGQNGRTPVMTAAAFGCRRVFDLLKTEGSDLSILSDHKDTILHAACNKDNVEFVKYLLTLNIVDINVRGQNGRTPVMTAAAFGCRRVFDLLKTEGSDLSILSDHKNTILHAACNKDNAEFVKYLLTLNIVDIHVRGQYARTPVMTAAAFGCRRVFDLLKTEGSDLFVLDDHKDTILHAACNKDNVEFVKYLLTLNIVDINVRGQNGRTPVMIAAVFGCGRVFDLLKTEGSDLFVLDDHKDTILHVACFNDNVEFVKYLLTLNIVDINVRGQIGMTPVMIAAAFGCRRVFDLLKTEGSDLSILDDHKNTILHAACNKDNVEFVKYLLTLNIVDINVRGQNGRTPVMTAAAFGCRRVFDLLKTEGSDLSVLDDDKSTILHAACNKDNVEFVKYLLTLNIVDINVRGEYARTPVMTAAQEGCRRVFDLLKTEGSDLSVLDDHKDTILHVACRYDNVEFVKYLLTLNIVDINVRGQYARTPVMTAATFGCRKVFDLLKTEGSDLSVLDDHKNTILHVACMYDNVEFVKYLLTLNIVDINVRGQYALTPVMTAAKFGCRKVFDLLKTEGSDLSILDDVRTLQCVCF